MGPNLTPGRELNLKINIGKKKKRQRSNGLPHGATCEGVGGGFAVVYSYM